MARLFKKNPKLKANATDHIKKHHNTEQRETHRDVYVDTNKGIENLKNQPIKGILKPNEPLPDYDSDDSGYGSDKSNKNKRAEPAPDYDLDEGKNRARDNWNKLIGKFKRAVIPEHDLGKLNEAIADSVRIKIVQPNPKQGDIYLQEIAQGKHVHGPAEFEILQMNPKELEVHKLTYDRRTGSLFDSKGKIASTIGKESKSMLDVQAFVMSKEGNIYVGTHKNQYSAKEKTLVHGSFLSGRSAEMAGVVRVSKNGKIDYISNNSGHYQPEEIDMYRGIKKIQEKMPGALDKNCLISFGYIPRRLRRNMAE
ncbi:hypothetical protein [Rickettsia endosymbiont of Gonocerus acuteangulatus]|uniref:hypothetical protein n=1 Tax=Rickettsia endosymbiont of Gonocerus acuteangulatus TaxID=3066266 RepID=UPI0031332CD7